MTYEPADVVPLPPPAEPGPHDRRSPLRGTGRERQRTDLGRRRRWGWAPVEEGLTDLGTYLETCRQLHGYTQGHVARALGMRVRDYQALIRRHIPPPSFDELERLVAAVGADPVRAAMRAWAMTWEEALGVGLEPLECDRRGVRLSQPPIRPNASRRWVSVRRGSNER